MRSVPAAGAPLMLTGEQAIARYDVVKRQVIPDRLNRRGDARYLDYARRMLQVYRGGTGQPRRKLHQAINRILLADGQCPSRRVAAFCKLLDDASEFHSDRAGSAAALRHKVFTLAAAYHPLVSTPQGIFCSSEQDVKHKIAAQLGCSWQEIDARLFADVIEFQTLRSFPGYESPQALLARYNVAQTQAALYRAQSLVVWARADFKHILRYAKLARLMHDIRPQSSGGYCFRFDGPASLLRRSTRYGAAMARFLPGLLACQDWRAVARIRRRDGSLFSLPLSSNDGLRSPAARCEPFDSRLEHDFFDAWGQTARDGWMLQRETDMIVQGQTVFTPDFTLVHADGRRVLMEIIGYWTPEYLAAKRNLLSRLQGTTMLLAVAQCISDQLPRLTPPPVSFKTKLPIAPILQWLQTYA